MTVEFTQHGWDDFTFWLETDLEIANKVRELIKAIQRDPFKGPGKPEPLRFGLKGCWSRRITLEHRLVYKVSGKKGTGQK